MDTMAYVFYEAGLPLASLSTRGDFELRQKIPLEIKKTTTLLYDEETLLDDKSPNFKHDVIDLNDVVMNRYALRDYSADYKPRYISSTRELSSQWLSSVNASGDPNEERRYFSYTMIIDIPTQEISFIPTFSDVIKDAWIKYLSIFTLLCVLLRELSSFVYRNQM
jgi:hypothetical protein